MTRIIAILLIALVLLLAVLVRAVLRQTSGAAPRFVPGTTASFASLSISYRDPVAHFAGGIVWGRGVRHGGSAEHPVLYDLDRRMVVGELVNAQPDFLNHDRTKLLCRQTGVSLKSRLAALVNKVSRGRFDNLAAQYFHLEILWVVNLRDGSATRIGQYSQYWKYDSEFSPSPGFRYGFTRFGDGPDLFLCDLEKDRFTKFNVAGNALGWWDGHNILVRDNAGGLALFDVVRGGSNTFFGIDAIAQSLREFGITNDAASLTFFSNWNGRDYDFYLLPRRRPVLQRRRSLERRSQRQQPHPSAASAPVAVGGTNTQRASIRPFCRALSTPIDRSGF